MSDSTARERAAALEAMLAQAYVDAEARARLAADPTVDAAGLALASVSFARKRAHKERHAPKRGWLRRLFG
jgi:hypothetical protein